MKYPVIQMMYFKNEVYRKGNNLISNAKKAEMNDSRKSHAGKRKTPPSFSESSPEKKRPKASPSTESQGSMQPIQLPSNLPEKTPPPSPTVATPPKATASTASGATPSTSSESDCFIHIGNKERITRYGPAAYLSIKPYKDSCAFGGEILRESVAWQVNVEFRQKIIKVENPMLICEVGFWTDQTAYNSSLPKIVKLKITLTMNDSLEFLIEGHGNSRKKSLKLNGAKSKILKIAFAWNISNRYALVYIDEEDDEDDLRWDLNFNDNIELCPILILEDTRKEDAVIAVSLKGGEEVEDKFKTFIDDWAKRKT